jgi:AcrR family transcriptional regulator
MSIGSRNEQRGERTRAAILQAAQNQFAARGYDATTIRSVASEADIDPSMVMRYFGSKDGLFAAATAVDLRIPDLADVPREQVGRAVARHFISTWEAESSAPLRVLLSAALAGSAAADRMVRVFGSQLEPVIAATRAADPEEASRRAGLVASQVLGFALCRYVLRIPPLVTLSPAIAEEWLGPTIQRYITGEEPKPGAAVARMGHA